MIRIKLKNAAVCLLLMAAGPVFAQSTPAVDSRISEVYGTYVPLLGQDQLQILTANLQRTEVQKIPAFTGEPYPLLSSLHVVNKYKPELQMDTVFDPQHINPLKYTIDFSVSKDQVYRIDGTDYVLLIHKKD